MIMSLLISSISANSSCVQPADSRASLICSAREPKVPTFHTESITASTPVSKILHHPHIALRGWGVNRNVLAIVRGDTPDGLVPQLRARKVVYLPEWMSVAGHVYV